MAHIVSCMLDSDGHELTGSLNTYIAKPGSPQPPNDQSDKASSEKPWNWRMHQAERKYQLFPKDKTLTLNVSGKGLDPEQAFALAMGQNGDKTDKAAAGNGLRLRIKEHNLIRRRKVSVPELGPMTTVQEVAMDSPTIPGRPPLHERSISAPGHSWRPHHLAEVIITTPPTHEEMAELDSPVIASAAEAKLSKGASRQPLSPKNLAPLVIPKHNSSMPRLTRQLSLTRLRSGSTPIEPTLRSARTDDSPKSRTPYTPLSASTLLTTPKSAVTSSTLPTPVSATMQGQVSPKPWNGNDGNYAVVSTPQESGLDKDATPRADTEPRSAPPVSLGHRRGVSESGSIMERGRPRKRGDLVVGIKRQPSKRSKSAEKRAFETLPRGWKAGEAAGMISESELVSIQRQALQQAARFEVLRKDDVENLSKELRNLDERTEYLRRTYTSLRAGRRNLHSRICQYLRSPRTARFSHDSMLKQEEALAELDASIDDWVGKLEQAENRRTRVRQKLLEHVAAAATLPSPTGGAHGASESLQLAMGIKPPPMLNGLGSISTPPRSPTKMVFSPHTTSGSPSPQRVVAQVPSTILEQPLVEEAAALDLQQSSSNNVRSRMDVESIRIYAGDDVYALLADVENEITKMSGGDMGALKEEDDMSDEERKQLHRARSHELLSAKKTASPPTSPGTSPVLTDSSGGSDFILSSAVFRPQKSMLAV